VPLIKRSELADLNVFVTIVRRRSFRRAASAVSHAMKALESRLGVKLLNRTSRSVVPTAAGSELAARLERGFQTIGDALGDLERFRASPMGRLRINVPRDAARLLLEPVIPRFVANFPDTQLDVTVDDRFVDIVGDGYDAGIRYGGRVPKDMVAMPLTGPLRWVVVGSPDYLARRGRPKVPQDLLHHACMRMRIGDNSAYKWELGAGDKAQEIDVPGPVSVNETDFSVAAALRGVALAYCLELRVANELRTGTLELVLPKWAAPGPAFYMYFPTGRQTPPGLRQLIDILREAYLPRRSWPQESPPRDTTPLGPAA
jgi:DNA-binding transcriptional LysR family regulator